MKSIYLQHDASASQDEKCTALLAKHGNWGYGCWWRINELLRMAEGYRLSASPGGIKALAYQLHEPRDRVARLLQACCEAKLYKERDGWFWSDRLSVDATRADAKREQTRSAGIARAEQMWKERSSERSANATAPGIANAIPPAQRDVETKKLKESKEAEEAARAMPSADFDNPDSLASQHLAILRTLPSGIIRSYSDTQALMDLASRLAAAGAPPQASTEAIRIFQARSGRSLGYLEGILRQALQDGSVPTMQGNNGHSPADEEAAAKAELERVLADRREMMRQNAAIAKAIDDSAGAKG